MSSCKPAVTPGESNVVMTHAMSPENQEEKDRMSKFPYRQAIGKLMFLMHGSRPDIAFEVGRLAQFLNNPGEEHWQRVKRILRYLRGTSNLCLKFGNIEGKASQEKDIVSLKGYCDSDYAGDHDTRKSTSGIIFTINGSPVSWSSKLQNIIAKSSTEAEYVSASEAANECLWLRQLLSDLLHPQSKATKIMIDNQAAIMLSRNPGYHHKSKHIDVRHHSIRQQQEMKSITLQYIPSNEQPADMLTKSLASPKLHSCLETLHITTHETN